MSPLDWAFDYLNWGAAKNVWWRSRQAGPVGADAGAPHHRAHLSLVPVCVGAAQLNLFLKCQLGRCLPGALPEGLLAFALKGVAALKSHLDLFVSPWLTALGCQGVVV